MGFLRAFGHNSSPEDTIPPSRGGILGDAGSESGNDHQHRAHGAHLLACKRNDVDHPPPLRTPWLSIALPHGEANLTFCANVRFPRTADERACTRKNVLSRDPPRRLA